MSQSNRSRFSRNVRLAAAAAFTLSAAGQAVAVPLTLGTNVEVGDVAGNVFTPAPVASDPSDLNGLYTGVTFLLNGARQVSASAGMFVLDQRPTTGGPWDQFLSFCLEPDVFLTPFSNPYRVDTLAGSGYLQANDPIGELWGRYRALVTNDTNAAAFQVALWELAYGTTDRDLADGAFRLTNNSGDRVYETAQGWLTSLDGTGPKADGLVVLVNNQQMADRQDLLTQTTSVPEPGTLALLALGLVGLGWSRQQKLHRSTTAA